MDQMIEKPPQGLRPLDHVDDIVAFRAAVRGWLAANIPTGWRERMTGATEAEYVEFQKWWFHKLREAGLATPHWPAAWGGVGLPFTHQVILVEECARLDGPLAELFIVSVYHMPSSLSGNVSAELAERYFSGVRDRGEVWCQGFSEPGAGSDLASLRTRAERRGDVYVVNGQKVWSSFGDRADYCLLLARTDPKAEKKTNGISFFILDLKSKGVTIRPIRQITGRSEFTEIFLDDVEIPAGNLIGAENKGWQVAQSTLAAERGLLIFEGAERMAHAFPRDFAALRALPSRPLDDAQMGRNYARLFAEITALRAMIKNMIEGGSHGPEAGMRAAEIKLMWALVLQRYTRFLVSAFGEDAQRVQPAVLGGGLNSGSTYIDFLQSYSWNISGGSNEIMRNLISERVLGLPR